MAETVTAAEFARQFPTLILSARELPRKRLPFHILLVSTIARLEPGRAYSEAEINAELQRWVLEFGQSFGLDHGSLRRYLVDEGYLGRDPAGTTYSVLPEGGAFTYEAAICDFDLSALVAEARLEREARKRAHAGPPPSG